METGLLTVAIKSWADGPHAFHALVALIVACCAAVHIRSLALPQNLDVAALLRQAATLNGAVVLAFLPLLSPLPAAGMAEWSMLGVALLLGCGFWIVALGMLAAPPGNRLGWIAVPAPGIAIALPALLLAATLEPALPFWHLGLLLALLPAGAAALLLRRPGSFGATLVAGLLLALAIAGSQTALGDLPGPDVAKLDPWLVALQAGLVTLLLRTAVAAWREARTDRQRLRMAADGLPDLAGASFEGIALLRNGVIVDANERLCAMLDAAPAAVVGQPIRSLFPDADVAWLQRLHGGEFMEAVPGRLAAGGRLLDVDVMARPLAMPGGDRVVVACRDRSEVLAAAQRIRHLSEHDTVTGLPARACFLAALARQMEQWRQERQSGRLLVVQVTGLRQLHQVQGSQAEATVLRDLAGRLGGAGGVALARLDSNSFALLLPPAATFQNQDAQAAVMALRARLAAPYPVGDAEVMLGIHAGVARCPEDGEDAEELLALADIAAERAAASPTEGIAFVQAERDQAQRQQRALEQDLRFATALGQLRLHWQPQVDLRSGLLNAFEVLVRWQHPLHGMIPPDRFLPAAEANGVIQEIGSWVLRTAAMEAATWSTPIPIAVNVSPVQMLRPGFPEEVAHLLAETGLPPGRLELEITESVLIEDKRRVLEALQALGTMGVKIAMDDFGTGYASIAMLRFFSFHKLKLDKSFLRDLEADPGARAILEAMLGLGRGLGMAVLVEGVETASQLAWLRANGCDHGQGYLFGRPAPIEDWDGSSLLVPSASAELPAQHQGQPWQQQEGGKGQAAARALPHHAAAPQPGAQHRQQPGHQGQGQFRRMQQGQNQGQLHVAAAENAGAPGWQQCEGGDQGAQKRCAVRPAPGQKPQRHKEEPEQDEGIADAPLAHVLRHAKNRPERLGAGQRDPEMMQHDARPRSPLRSRGKSDASAPIRKRSGRGGTPAAPGAGPSAADLPPARAEGPSPGGIDLQMENNRT
jgi:predicted signal transduction protein with EAL and GGDEF domain